MPRKTGESADGAASELSTESIAEPKARYDESTCEVGDVVLFYPSADETLRAFPAIVLGNTPRYVTLRVHRESNMQCAVGIRHISDPEFVKNPHTRGNGAWKHRPETVAIRNLLASVN